MPPGQPPPPTEDVSRALHFWARNACNQSAVLITAQRIGLLRALSLDTPASVAELAKAVGGTFRGVRSLLEPLDALGIVVQSEDGRLRFAPEPGALLKSDAFAREIDRAAAWWRPFAALTDAVRSGQEVTFDGRSFDLLGHLTELFDLAAEPALQTWAGRLKDTVARDYLRTRAILTAGALGLLEPLAEGRAPLAALAAKLSASERGLRALLQTLEHMGLVDQREGTFGYVAKAAELLTPKGLPYFLRTLPVTEVYWEPLARLDEAVLHQRFALDLKDPETSQRFYSENARQITGIFASHFQIARSAARALQAARGLSAAEILDVGTGSGVWGAAFLHTEPTARVTFCDQPEVLKQAEGNLKRLKLAERAAFLPGSCLEVEFGEHRFDAVILPQVCNVLAPADLHRLFQRVARALRPGGLLLVAEYVLTDRRDGPIDYLYFGLRRYMSNEGDLLSLKEYTGLLGEVGLTHVSCLPLPAQELILASRDGRGHPSALAS